jgi:hypothetical protein
MNNEIINFFNFHQNKLETLIDEAKIIMEIKKINDVFAFRLLNILFEIIKSNKKENYIKKIEETIDEEKSNLIKSFINEEQVNIIEFFNFMKNQQEIERVKLVDFEWKFVLNSSITNNDDAMPKILVKLIFNNSQTKIFETDYSNFKKLHEEIEENLSAFNSTYAKRIENFSK